MGQTLTHGVYLPDEGERNCYSGLAANWSILDGAVGTIAEHTSALSGKAPLVHTHTKSQITDFPAFGTTAGTICEGNDSRLSDARTPVAHTHTKSDVTDLFNSANTWTNTNTFQQNITYERTNFFHQAVNPCYYLKDTGLEKGSTAPTAHSAYTGNWQDKNGVNLGYVRFVEYDTGKQTAEIRVSNLIKNGALDPTGSVVNCTFLLELQPSGAKSLIPEQNNDINLGTSTNKWKTLNGINPGALSLPDYNNVLDVTSEIPIASLDGNTQININDYLADKTGWLSIVIDDTAGNSIIVTQGKSGGATAFNNSRTFHTGAQSNGYISVFFPIIAGTSKIAFIKASSLIQMRFYYCLGNV